MIEAENGNSGKAVIVFYALNPVAMLDLELSLREAAGDAALLYPLGSLGDLTQLAHDGDVVLFLLDGKLNAASYAPLDPQDPRIWLLADHPDASAQEIERQPSVFALRKIPAIAHLLSRS